MASLSSTIRFLLLNFGLLVLLVFLFQTAEPARAQGSDVDGADVQTWQYRYNQNATLWKVETGMPKLETTVHEFNDLEGYSRQGCEFFSFVIPESGPLYLGAEIPTGLLKPDVLPSVFLKSDRTGYRLFLRVILPNSFSEKGEPLSFWLEGTVYSTVNRWQQLRVEKPAEQLSALVQAASAEKSLNINTANAFYDRMYLNLGGGTGTIKVWIDDLEINGFEAVNGNELLSNGRKNASSAGGLALESGTAAAGISGGAGEGLDSSDTTAAPVPLTVQPIPGTEAPPSTVNPSAPLDPVSSESAPPKYPGHENITDQGAWGTSISLPSPPPIPGESVAAGDSNRLGTADGSLELNKASSGGNVLPTVPGATGINGSSENVLQDSLGPKSPDNRVNGDDSNVKPDKSFFPRGIRYRGEPLQLLRDIGFNTVWLTSPPTAEFQEQARELGLWIIAPPPLEEIKSSESQTVLKLGNRYPRVLAWDLGPVDKLGITPDQMREIKDLLDQADNPEPRPVICQTQKEFLNYAPNCNILLIEKSALYSSLSFRRLLQWEMEMPLLIRKSLPLWGVVSTQPDADLLKQWQLMFPDNTYPTSYPVEQLLIQTIISLHGKRGALFESYTPLSNTDIDTENRRKSLELINYYLETIDSFLASGTLSVYDDRNDPKRTILVYRIRERGQVVIPLYLEEDSQYVVKGMSSSGTTIVVPGVPNTYQPYHMSPNGLEPVNSVRQTGGVRFAIDNQEPVSFYLLCRTPLVISSMSNRLRKYGPRIAELKRELTMWRLMNLRQWVDFKRATADEMRTLDQAQQMLQLSQSSIQQSVYSNGYNYANRAAQAISALEYLYWSKATGSAKSPVMHPADVCLRSIRLYRQWEEESLKYKLGENLLLGGDFESADIFRTGAWKNVCDPKLPVYAALEMSPEAAQTGKYGLRLLSWAKSQDKESNPRLLDNSPLKLYVPDVKVEPGQLVRISMSLNIPNPITGTVDGLIIREEGSGEALQARISKTLSWNRVTLFRAADESGLIRLTIELTGYGEAWIDNLRIQPVVLRQQNETGNVNQD